MRSFAAVTLCFAAIFISARPAHAENHIDCSGAEFSEVRSLTELPQEVLALLSQNRADQEELSDRDGKFNVGDVGWGPRRRFVLAAANPSCILVAIEHGGIAYFVEMWAFERSQFGWRSEIRKGWFGKPSSLNDLIAHASK